MTQRERIEKQLRETGEVSRNWALSQYISRLGAITHYMRADGWQLEASRRGKDYVYTLVDTPKRPVYVYELVDGVRVPRLTYQNV